MDSEDLSTVCSGEILYRRLGGGLVLQMHPEWNGETVYPEWFMPRKNDASGLSLYRQSMLSPEDIAPQVAKHPYYILQVSIDTVEANGGSVVVVPDHISESGHIEIPELNYSEKSTPLAEGLMRAMATDATSRGVLGPYDHHLENTID